MVSIQKAEPKDASLLSNLYAKLLTKTGFATCATPEKREELIVWLESVARDGELLFVRDDQGPISLGYYNHEKGEVVGVVTRDGMERQGYAAAILEEFASSYPAVKLRPVTREGKALARKCGFSVSEDDRSVWCRPLQGHS